MLERIRLSASVGCSHPVTVRKVSLMTGGIEHCGTTHERTTLLLNGPGLRWCSQHCAVEWTRAKVVFATLCC